MRTVLLLTVLAGACLTALAPGQTPPAQTTPPSNFDSWIEQLGDEDFRKRDQAVQLLQAQGAAALPALRKAINHPDLEIRRRALELIPTLEMLAVLAPRRITYKAVNKPLQDIFNEITRQTGLKVEFWANNPQQSYSVDFRDKTFWEALDMLCRDANLVVQNGYGDDRIRLNQQNGYVPYLVHQGAFRFTANNIHQARSIDLSLVNRDAGPGQKHESLTFGFTVFVEPRLSILGMGEVKLTSAYDNENNSLLTEQSAPDPEAVWMAARRWSSGRYGNRSNTIQTSVNLRRVSEKASTIKVLRGSVPVNLLAEQKPVVLAEKVLGVKGKKMKVDTTSFILHEVVELPTKQIQVKISITEENKDSNDFSWMNTMYQRLQLLDEKGTPFQTYGTSWGNSGPNHVDLTLTFGQPANGKGEPPSKLVFMSWNTVTHLLTFEFKDIPLP